MVATYDEASAVGLLLFSVDLADKLTVGDVFYVVLRDVLLSDEVDGVGSFDTTTNSIGEAAKFISR